MNKADYINELTVIDPDTKNPVEVALYKDRESGGIFGVDSSYILTLSDDDPVNNPFNGQPIMLAETQQAELFDVRITSTRSSQCHNPERRICSQDVVMSRGDCTVAFTLQGEHAWGAQSHDCYEEAQWYCFYVYGITITAGDVSHKVSFDSDVSDLLDAMVRVSDSAGVAFDDPSFSFEVKTTIEQTTESASNLYAAIMRQLSN